MELNEKAVSNTPVETVKAAEVNPAQPQEKSHNRPNQPTDHQRGYRPNRGGRNFKGNRRDRNEYIEKVISINRVSKTVKGGRRIRFSALVAIGDGKGSIGFATGKANEVPDAIKKALEAAKKEMFKVSVAKGDTIPHEINGKYGACKVFLKPARQGTGVIAGGPVRAIMELAGVKNIYSKVYGSRTAINMVRATVNGLQGLKTPQQIATLRGKSVEEIKA